LKPTWICSWEIFRKCFGPGCFRVLSVTLSSSSKLLLCLLLLYFETTNSSYDLDGDMEAYSSSVVLWRYVPNCGLFCSSNLIFSFSFYDTFPAWRYLTCSLSMSSYCSISSSRYGAKGSTLLVFLIMPSFYVSKFWTSGVISGAAHTSMTGPPFWDFFSPYGVFWHDLQQYNYTPKFLAELIVFVIISKNEALEKSFSISLAFSCCEGILISLSSLLCYVWIESNRERTRWICKSHYSNLIFRSLVSTVPSIYSEICGSLVCIKPLITF